jgi:hypothetical protein
MWNPSPSLTFCEVTNHKRPTSWQYMDPGLAPRAHHVEDLRREATEYRFTRDLMLRRRHQRLAGVEAWITGVLWPAVWRRRRKARSLVADEVYPASSPAEL